jgi:hypothetical protein
MKVAATQGAPTTYSPVIRVLDNVGWARRLNALIEPVLRGLAGR